MLERIEFRLNGRPMRLEAEGDRKLLWVLRSDFALTGTKYGCGKGLCGACTVLINEQSHRSCQVPVRDVRGKEVITIEGLAKGEALHPLQKAFLEHDAFQCGFCTPGMILNAYSALKENPAPPRRRSSRTWTGTSVAAGLIPELFGRSRPQPGR